MMTVNVRASKEYNVEIGDGIVTKLGELTKSVCPKAIKALIVSETNVASLYLDVVKAQLEGAGLEVFTYVFEAGEKSKNINEIAGMWDKMAEAGFTRTDFILCLHSLPKRPAPTFSSLCPLHETGVQQRDSF